MDEINEIVEGLQDENNTEDTQDTQDLEKDKKDIPNPEEKVKQKQEDRSKIDGFLTNRDAEEEDLILDFAKAILKLEIEIKDIKDDIKEVKNDAKENGVPVTKVNKALANIKKMMKEDSLDAKEINNIQSKLIEDIDVKAMMTELTEKKK